MVKRQWGGGGGGGGTRYHVGGRGTVVVTPLLLCVGPLHINFWRAVISFLVYSI